ncbi:MAG TPA: HAD family phosphatase [Streptosporangiaceae bacterium]
MSRYHDMTDSGPAPRGVIIDWGGVLTNSIRDTVAAWAQAEGVDWKTYVAVMRPWVEEGYHPDATGNPVHALERGECTVEDFERMFAARLRRVDGGTVPADGLLRRMFAASLTVPAMYDMLRTLRAAGFRTCLLSNSWGPGDYQRDDFPELFDAVVISGEVGMRKPERRIFLHAAELIGLTPGECVFIDDIEANVTAAVACGMAGVRHEDPRVTAERLTALLGTPLTA